MANSSSLTASLFGGLLLFGGGYAVFDFTAQTAARGPELSLGDYVSDLPNRVFKTNAAELERPILSYLPPADGASGWARAEMTEADYLLLLPPQVQDSLPNPDRTSKVLAFNYRVRNTVVYDDTTRETHTYMRGDDTVILNVLWSDAARQKGFSGGLRSAMQDGKRPNLDLMPVFLTAQGLSFHQRGDGDDGITHLTAQIGRQVDITLATNLAPDALASFLQGLDIAGLNARLERPLPQIDPALPVQFAAR